MQSAEVRFIIGMSVLCGFVVLEGSLHLSSFLEASLNREVCVICGFVVYRCVLFLIYELVITRGSLNWSLDILTASNDCRGLLLPGYTAPKYYA